MSAGYFQVLTSSKQKKVSMMILKCFNLFSLSTPEHTKEEPTVIITIFLCFKIKLFNQWEKDTKQQQQQQHEAAGKTKARQKGATTNERKRWPCPECGKTPLNLVRHLSKVHEKLGWTSEKAERYFVNSIKNS